MSTPTELQERAIELAKTGTFGASALEANLELTRVAPGNEGAWTRLARCHLEAGQLNDATAALDAVLQVEPAEQRGSEPPGRSDQAAHGRDGGRQAGRGAGAPAQGGAARTCTAAPAAAFGRPEFAALAQLAPAAATDVLGTRLEALVMAVNDRPFAERVVEARNRAGHSGARLFRRNSVVSAGTGHIQAFQYGGRWEPQLNVGLIAATHPAGGRDCARAGIGFNLTPDAVDRKGEEGHARVLAYFAQFQQLLKAEWGGFLTGWFAGHGAHVQIGTAHPPATTLSPIEAIQRCSTARTPRQPAGYSAVAGCSRTSRPTPRRWPTRGGSPDGSKAA